MAQETILMEWSPSRPHGKTKIKTKLASVEQVQAAMSESTRAALSPDGWKLCLRDKDKNELYNLRTDPREISFRYGPSGKPELAGRGDESLQFNLSHSGGLALYAISRARELGVDLERDCFLAERE